MKTVPFTLPFRHCLYCVALAGVFALTSCVSPGAASTRYRETRDYSSLKALSRCLEPGMSVSEVTLLLGEPAYWPCDTQCYYPSDKRSAVEDEDISLEFTHTLVINFEISAPDSGLRVRDWFLGPIGE